MEKSTPSFSAAQRRLAYTVLDVFTRRALEGNQLAVFPDARGLSDAEMQALAREMNLSETTFIVPREEKIEREQGVKVRIFTVAEELEFAGHPTLGTAAVIHSLRSGPSSEPVVLELRVGKVPVTFTSKPGDSLPFGEMRQRDPVAGAVHSREEVARATGLSANDFDPGLPIQTFSTGMAFAIVPLRSLEVIRSLNFSWKSVAQYAERTDAKFLYFVTRETVAADARLHARMIFYNGEDPATGSAAGCAAAWMVAHGVAAPEEQVMIEQGIQTKRPSQIFVRASRKGDEIHNVRVGGYAVEVARGEIFL